MNENDHLSEDLVQFKLEPAFDDLLYGTSFADNIRHVIARSELLKALVRDSRVQARLQTWGEQTGLTPAVRTLARVLVHWEQAASPGELSSPADMPALLEPLTAAVQRLAAHRDEVHRYVRGELGLPWQWVTSDLLQQMVLYAWAAIFGRRIQVTCRVLPAEFDAKAPPLTFTFAMAPGESFSAAIVRFAAEAEAFWRTLKAAAPTPVVPAGRISADLRKEARDGVGKYARWYYEHRLCHKRQYAIGKAYHLEQGHLNVYGTPSCDCKGTVRKGIAEAERLLSLAE